MGIFGKPGKAGGVRRPEQVPAGTAGRNSGSNEIAAAPFAFGVQPMALRTATALFMATSLMSPMVRGRFRTGDRGAPANRAVTGRSDGEGVGSGQ